MKFWPQVPFKSKLFEWFLCDGKFGLYWNNNTKNPTNMFFSKTIESNVSFANPYDFVNIFNDYLTNAPLGIKSLIKYFR